MSVLAASGARHMAPQTYRLVMACPTYGPLDPQAVVSQRCAIMHAAEHGHTWIGDSSPDRMGWTVARNKIVEGVIQTEADYVCWVDSDVILPPFAFTELLRTQHDFVTGIYHQRHPPHYPLIAHYNQDRDTFAWYVEWPQNVIAPIDGCGFGCVVTSTKLLKALDPPWFHYEKFSEDFDFCRKAARAGFQLYVHTGVQCGHLQDPRPATVAEFKTAWETEHLKEPHHV